MSVFENEPLMIAIREQYRLNYENGVHGVQHWARVRVTALRLAENTPGVRVDVLELFAVLHDACRHNDFADHDHGPRAAVLAQELHAQGLFELDKAGMKLLVRAIHVHTGGEVESDLTIGCAWDADRLDLPRVGKRVKAEYLSTQAAKDEIT